MRRGIWVGAAILVAVAAAIPLWLVVHDGGVRRLGALDPATVHGEAGRLTLGTSPPIAIDSFVFRMRRPAGASQPELDSIEVTFPSDSSMPQLVGRAVQGSKAESAKVELVRSIDGALTTYLKFDLTNVASTASTMPTPLPTGTPTGRKRSRSATTR
jgi:hypothetical protein